MGYIDLRIMTKVKVIVWSRGGDWIQFQEENLQVLLPEDGGSYGQQIKTCWYIAKKTPSCNGVGTRYKGSFWSSPNLRIISLVIRETYKCKEELI